MNYVFCTIANLRIKCVTETKNVSVLFYKNLKSSFSTWLIGFFTLLVALAHGGGVGKIEGGGVTARRLSHATTPPVDACLPLPHEMVN